MYNMGKRKLRRLMTDRVLCQEDFRVKERLELFHAPKGTNKKVEKKSS